MLTFDLQRFRLAQPTPCLASFKLLSHFEPFASVIQHSKNMGLLCYFRLEYPREKCHVMSTTKRWKFWMGLIILLNPALVSGLIIYNESHFSLLVFTTVSLWMSSIVPVTSSSVRKGAIFLWQHLVYMCMTQKSSV